LPKDDFYTPTDIDALRMENELLTFEVRFLKARLAEPERTVAQLEESRAQLEESRAQLEESRAQLEARLSEAEKSRAHLKARLEGVESDLVTLLRGLLTSPFGRFLRLKRNFRVLEQRYLGTDA
jgi:septal ring factor EnvC (AmiA/AmiB activator)